MVCFCLCHSGCFYYLTKPKGQGGEEKIHLTISKKFLLLQTQKQSQLLFSLLTNLSLLSIIISCSNPPHEETTSKLQNKHKAYTLRIRTQIHLSWSWVFPRGGEMEELGKGWDLARQDLLGQYLNNSATFPRVSIFAKEMYWNVRLCLILLNCFCLLCELVEIHEWHWWWSTLTPLSLDTFQRSQHT